MREQKRENGENIIFLFFTGKNLGARHLQAKKKFVKIKNKAHLEKKKIRMRKSEENKR